ncbi:MAG TPA: M12 family metallo-peptidase [Flavobacterium sp.]|nr:M12 family metallo-peptidase [Flavobacterium sp.]
MKKLLLLLVAFLMTLGAFAQQPIWQKIKPEQVASEKLHRDSNPTKFLVYALNMDALKQQLQTAPSRQSNTESNTIVSFPTPQGDLQRFRIYEASIMHPELAARFTDIQSYVGIGLDDKSATIRFTTTLFGLHTMAFSGVQGTFFIDPYSVDKKNYMVFNKADLTTTRSFRCDVADTPDNLVEDLDVQGPLYRANNSLFKTFRLALSCTIEYAAFHVNAAGLGGGTLIQKKAAVLAAMVVTMTRVNGVFERDMSMTLQLIANNDAIINITSDNLDNNNNANVLLQQNQDFIDTVIGNANYDIGHVATTGGGGVASQGPCQPTSKARGVTGLPSPVGDEYDIDFVAHEMGHQFGCSHTFNGDAGNCGGGNRVTSSAYEPGSGTTIMGYAGICSPQDVQAHSDAYYHARSIIQMSAYLVNNDNCSVSVPSGNTPPTVSAGANYTIPYGTAFVLTGSATDAENQAGLTYCWEQYNFNIATQPPVASSAIGPNFRSFNPTVSTSRYFPRFQDVLANNLTPTWEVVPNVARIMTFSLVVRDNQVGNGGQTERATMNLTLANTGPFKVTSQSALEAWPQGSSQTVTWDVAGTTANGINTANVNIRMSIDGGATFPIMLAANTPNDGSEVITAPNFTSQTCRILIEAVDNVFYAVNSATFYVGYQLVTTCRAYVFNTPFAVPNGSNSYTVKNINVPDPGVISDVNITINATHPNLQNLTMAVIRPNGGTLSTLFTQQCSGNSNMNVTFDAQGSAFTCASPTVGTYVPPSGYNLNLMNGFNPTGNWQFGFKDNVAGADAGTINSITLEICSQSLAVSDYEFENFAIYPNPNKGNFTVQFESRSGNKINIAVHDMSGRKIFDKHYNNNGLFAQDLQLDNAQAGVYLVSITDGSKKTVKRIVVQ